MVKYLGGVKGNRGGKHGQNTLYTYIKIFIELMILKEKRKLSFFVLPPNLVFKEKHIKVS